MFGEIIVFDPDPLITALFGVTVSKDSMKHTFELNLKPRSDDA